MTDTSDVRLRRNWRDNRAYEPLLADDRRAWAWEWLSRNAEFTAAAAKAAMALHVLRMDPPLAVVAMADDEKLAPWGLHCCIARASFRESACRALARRLRSRRRRYGSCPRRSWHAVRLRSGAASMSDHRGDRRPHRARAGR